MITIYNDIFFKTTWVLQKRMPKNCRSTVCDSPWKPVGTKAQKMTFFTRGAKCDMSDMYHPWHHVRSSLNFASGMVKISWLDLIFRGWSFWHKILICRSLPNFADEKTGRPMLRPSDSEALLSYLTVSQVCSRFRCCFDIPTHIVFRWNFHGFGDRTYSKPTDPNASLIICDCPAKVPYLRQPLLLSFFTTQDRSNCLRQGTLQKILQATMLEPGKLLYPEDMQKIPEYVPAIAEEEHLVASPFSQILTELSHGPAQILTAVGKLMALTLSLATSVTSETVPAILFSVRLAVRVESAAALLMDHAEGRVARAWPRLTTTPHVLEELRRGRVLLRSTFEGEAAWWRFFDSR